MLSGWVTEYRKRAEQCRDLAARAAHPAEKKSFEYLAEAWAKIAAVRECELTNKTFAACKSRKKLGAVPGGKSFLSFNVGNPNEDP
jgi:hypothetical protein